jgi:hypothetical protein
MTYVKFIVYGAISWSDYHGTRISCNDGSAKRVQEEQEHTILSSNDQGR